MSASIAKRGNDHSFNQLMWIVFHQSPIFKSAGLHFVGVADQVLRMRRILAHGYKAPLHTGGKSGAAAAAKIRRFD